MSSDDHSDSSSESEDLSTTGLIATRQKRATAGNLYATLRANLDDEELQKELLAEDEEGDAGDYEGSDKGGSDDEALDSSSEDSDAGPPQEGETEDLSGEKALKKQERAEARKKRRTVDARLKLPAWQKKQKPTKRVHLAIDADAKPSSHESTPARERPRKKSERANWLPTPADAPIRQSGRALAVANREIVHAHLKQSAERSEKQRRVMKHAAEREQHKRRMVEMGQGERLKKCERIERETAREFGRWEREEQERQRLREEALAAKRKRGVEGPYFRWWSGSVVWEGERIKVRRVGSEGRKIEEMGKEENTEVGGKEGDVLEAFKKGELGGESGEQVSSAGAGQEQPLQQQDPESTLAPSVVQPAVQEPPTVSTATQETSTQPPVPWLQGIQEYAAQPTTNSASVEPVINGYTPSAPAINGALPSQSQPLPPYPPPFYQTQHQPVQTYHGWPPGSHEFPLYPHSHPAQQPQPPPTSIAAPPPAPPLLREQAQRTLLILSQFPTLDTPHQTNNSTKRTSKSTTTTNPSLNAPDPLKSILLPHNLPPSLTLTAEETKYLTTRPRKRTNLNEHPLPAPPARAKCAITSWPAKFRDPKTGLAYADLHQYKAVQRVVAGGCRWSAGLGCWVGPEAGGGVGMGRAARGVPEGFLGRGEKREEVVEEGSS